MKKKKPCAPKQITKPLVKRTVLCVAVGASALALGTALGLGWIGGGGRNGLQPAPAGFPVQSLTNGVWEKPQAPGESDALVFEGMSEGGFSGKVRLYSAASKSGAPIGEGWEEVSSEGVGSNVKLYRSDNGRMRIVVADPIGGDAASIAVFEGAISNRGNAGKSR